MSTASDAELPETYINACKGFIHGTTPSSKVKAIERRLRKMGFQDLWFFKASAQAIIESGTLSEPIKATYTPIVE